MRFVNTESLRFTYVPDSKIESEENKYAVLSHRWGASSDEISFVDIEESRDYSHKKAFTKFKGFCDLASHLGCRYGWIDTCCINKGDSLEMSEAINSMYRWYQGSSICIIHLEDVPTKPLLESVWFDRGWTLQELIAPKEANFYDRDWRLIGLKTELLQALSTKTGIPEGVLDHTMQPSACSVAQRMSWAAKRETIRVEDRAYSLLGIFDVSMPQIYGEREAAFVRLQRAITQQSKDETIFAWPMSDKDGDQTYTGLFAQSPSDFLGCNNVISVRGSTGFSETNGELSIKLRTFPYSIETYGALLNCTYQASPEERMAILLARLSTEGEYVRVKRAIPGGHIMVAPPSRIGRLKERMIRVSLALNEPPLSCIYGFRLRTIKPPGHAVCQPRILSRSQSNVKADNLVCVADGDRGTAGVVYMECSHHMGPRWSKVRWLKFGFDDEFNPRIYLGNGMREYPMNVDDPRNQPFPDQLEQIIMRPEDTSTPKVRRELFSNRWISASGWVPSRRYGWPNGVSILKVDKRKGIQGRLRALNLGISVKLLPISSCFPASTNEKPNVDTLSSSSAPYIWTVDLTELTEGDPEVELRKLEKDEYAPWILRCFCFCCDDCDDGSLEERSAQRHRAASQTKQLGAEDLS